MMEAKPRQPKHWRPLAGGDVDGSGAGCGNAGNDANVVAPDVAAPETTPNVVPDVVTLEMTPTVMTPVVMMPKMSPNVTAPDKWVSVREEERGDFAI